MGQLIAGISLLLVALLIGTGFYLEFSSDTFSPDSPLDVGPDTGLPGDGQDGNIVVEIDGQDETDPVLPARRQPGDPDPLEVITRLTPEEKARLHGRGYLPYVVKPGDTLTKLAAHYLGDGKRWSTLLEHNRSRLIEPSHLRPGMTIQIPTWLNKDL